MRYSKEHKEQTRQRILEAAGRVFRRQGYQGGGVDAVMREAGLTHGGFYAHFPNKEALFAETIRTTMEGLPFWQRQEDDDLHWLDQIFEGYLSDQHLQSMAEGCPAPPLASEVARAGDAAQEAFEEGARGIQALIEGRLGHLPEAERRPAALAILATLVGTLGLARAVHDDRFASEILAASREHLRQSMLPQNT